MSSTTGHRRDVWWQASPNGRRAPARGLRALLRAFRQWWSKEPYRPERRYMRG